ncbi:hypothetical protein R5R35_007201 [Gryllus longicercus]|uniref:Uncharacterized protein n=1 Tax=Gryllus longicercus TaxID=2509291 RepID=A0AAN9V6M2_9ORTH
MSTQTSLLTARVRSSNLVPPAIYARVNVTRMGGHCPSTCRAPPPLPLGIRHNSHCVPAPPQPRSPRSLAPSSGPGSHPPSSVPTFFLRLSRNALASPLPRRLPTRFPSAAATTPPPPPPRLPTRS